MTTWIWVSQDALMLAQEASIARHGGRAGLREKGLLDAALARPMNLAAYGKPDAAELAASYAIGITKINHPFVDGNKRAGHIAMRAFLKLNGLDLKASDEEKIAVMLSIAAGGISEEELARWLRGRIVAIVDDALDLMERR